MCSKENKCQNISGKNKQKKNHAKIEDIYLNIQGTLKDWQPSN